MAPEERLAVHEAAHAVVALVRGVPVTRCTIEADRASLGHVQPAVPIGTIDTFDLLEFWLAGGAAERKATGTPARGDAYDLEMARLLVSAMLGTEPGSAATAAAVGRYAVIADVEIELAWPWIRRVATALVRKRTLDGASVADLM
jgi:hypothetical protein